MEYKFWYERRHAFLAGTSCVDVFCARRDDDTLQRVGRGADTAVSRSSVGAAQLSYRRSGTPKLGETAAGIWPRAVLRYERGGDA